MIAPVPFQPRRFQSAAQHYLGGRPPYADRLIALVAEHCRLRRTDRLLDLGCGPGPLAIAFAPLVGSVLAIDPEPEMLRIAASAAAEAGVTVEFVAGSSYDLGTQLGRFRLVTIGRAFHWMDRVETLRRLAEIVEPDGAIALFGDDHPRVPDNRWQRDYKALIERYAEGDTVRAQVKSPDWVPHEAVLLDSPFAALERISVIERRRILGSVEEKMPARGQAQGEARHGLRHRHSGHPTIPIRRRRTILARRQAGRGSPYASGCATLKSTGPREWPSREADRPCRRASAECPCPRDRHQSWS